ncbi:SRPBCC domain-containing protein [Flavobacterium sp. MXW15]|uniref:SRPBCC domain-containing protein n=1 Tax=Xanthomonas chitinilytica TaxID=2989819 RepID=A0ABT3JYA3_9XANT|nr:SRPBCC domain-containing protein [Xanthomonas sp. H13-6]MCW4455452.1 SRPBCC domain-containing protein [Flavobacterium sp. MXW15]MCW4473467.1 SRPBCC domain-containing protein [Xanthomonas sp. H13-6]
MASIHHQIWIDAPVATVYGALVDAEGLGRWWAPHSESEEDGTRVLAHSPGPAHGLVRMKVLEALPDRRIRWEIVSDHPLQSPASAWTGTHVCFDLSRRASLGHWRGMDKEGEPFTVVEFRHIGWDPENEFLGFCSQAWAETLLMLKQWAEAQTRHD